MINKNKWRSVENERTKIAPDKVKYFIYIFDLVVHHYGSIDKAVNSAGIGHGSYYKMVNESVLSVCVAHRIMDAYTEIAPYNQAAKNAKSA